MIPRIANISSVQSHYLHFFSALKNAGFEGDISHNYASRTALATDNSIYQVFPQGVVYPRNIADIVLITSLANQPEYHVIVLSPRGGGTGTNAQSLTDGVVVDVTRYMTNILEINVEQGWVRVQAGVVKDQLNASLKAHGLFFAPDTSTSNRATIGGMINTDASGQGSCLYGKTRDHVIELKTVLMDASILQTKSLSQIELEAQKEQQDASGVLYRVIDQIEQQNRDLIQEKFPPLNRCLTGYDLAHVREESGDFNLNNILCGSEGTLGFVVEAKLNVLPLPTHSALVIVNYDSFDSALRDAPRLMKAGPTSIETIDSTILNLAINDPNTWSEVSSFFKNVDTQKIQGMNLVEYTADSRTELSDALAKLIVVFKEDDAGSGFIGHALAWGDESVKKIWNMRKKAVGLLGNLQSEARPIPFVEDTAVPPEHLADFIQEFRRILDGYNLKYGMFGHVDAGVLHVRPAIDMKDNEQAKLIREITDQVVALTLKYNGLLWGEHGKGVRSEYSPEFFGELYPQLQRIKGIFDPYNQLNPGKIATPANGITLLKIDEVSTRGQNDQQIPAKLWEEYNDAAYCNGNGACFNWELDDAMCPSWKATRDRVHSPKGRASLIKEWLKQLARHDFNPNTPVQKPHSLLDKYNIYSTRKKNTLAMKKGEYDFSHEVMEAMKGCLSCKSCAGQCPIKVNVPNFKSKFLNLYHTRYTRPAKDYLVAALETLLPVASRFASLSNFFSSLGIVKKTLHKYFDFVDSPKLSTVNFNKKLTALNIDYATPENVALLNAQDREKTVVLIQDAFTRYFEAQLVIDVLELLKKLGFNVFVSPYKPNGKALHVHGFLERFELTAKENTKMLRAYNLANVTCIGLDPAVTLTYRDEYRDIVGPENAPDVMLIQEWLIEHKEQLENQAKNFTPKNFKLMPHCTEKTNAPASIAAWQTVFENLNLELNILNSGCCGMSGTYGHESYNRELSSTIYQMSWYDPVTESTAEEELLATGYSCRSQVKRESNKQLLHPLQALLRQYQNGSVSKTSNEKIEHEASLA